MAFTTISRLHLDQGNGGPAGYFYPEDIAIVLNQLSAEGRPAVTVQVRNAISAHGQIECTVLVAVTQYENLNSTSGPPGQVTEALTDAHHWVAIKCPPYAHPGGEFLERP